MLLQKNYSWGFKLNLKDKYIALPGIIFPNIFGTITLFFSVISILYIKLTKNKFSYKLFSLNKTNLTLAYCLFHILIPFSFQLILISMLSLNHLYL